jgi:hypothetical protein
MTAGSLIPGDPEHLYATVAALTQYADLLDEAANGLARIDTGSGWTGQAADAFHRAYQTQPPQWQKAGGAFRDAAGAMDNYAQTLAWAQQQAASAQRLLDSSTGSPASVQAVKAEADNILANARAILADAGDRAAGVLSRAASVAPPAPGFWQQVGHYLESRFDAIARDPGALAEEVGGELGTLAAIGAGLLAPGVGQAAVAIVGGTLGYQFLVVKPGADSLAAQQRADQLAAQGAGVSYTPAAPATAQQMADQASQLGYGRAVPPGQAPFDSHGQPVYSDGGSFITPDGNGWQMFDHSGNVLGSYSWDLTYARK